MYEYDLNNSEEIDLTKLDFGLEGRALDREIIIKIRANDDGAFKLLAEGAQFIVQELKDEIAQIKNP